MFQNTTICNARDTATLIANLHKYNFSVPEIDLILTNMNLMNALGSFFDDIPETFSALKDTDLQEKSLKTFCKHFNKIYYISQIRQRT